MKLIKVGIIATTHGIKGELKIIADNPCFRADFKKSLYIILGDDKVEVHIKTCRRQNDRMIVSFKEFNDINQVIKFRGLSIYALEEDLEPLKDDEFYISDLIGLEVVNEEGKKLGKVLDVIKYPQCFYLVVQHEDKEVLVPFIDEFIISVEEEIIIRQMEGLF